MGKVESNFVQVPRRGSGSGSGSTATCGCAVTLNFVQECHNKVAAAVALNRGGRPHYYLVVTRNSIPLRTRRWQCCRCLVGTLLNEIQFHCAFRIMGGPQRFARHHVGVQSGGTFWGGGPPTPKCTIWGPGGPKKDYVFFALPYYLLALRIALKMVRECGPPTPHGIQKYPLDPPCRGGTHYHPH